MYRLSAEQGNELAQLNLGLKNEKGQGVPKNYEEAVKFYLLAAEKGVALAQYILGWMYGKGQGIPRDYELAHMWFNLSALNGIEDGEENRKLIEKRMAPSQIKKAQEMVRSWKPKKIKQTYEH